MAENRSEIELMLEVSSENKIEGLEELSENKIEGLKDESKKKMKEKEKEVEDSKKNISANPEEVEIDLSESGYWKKTKTVRDVKSGSNVIGTKRKLFFYGGGAPHGRRTKWMVHEYCIGDQPNYYIEPLSRKRFKTKKEVEHYIETEAFKPSFAGTSKGTTSKGTSDPAVDELISAGWAFDPLSIPHHVKWSLADASTNSWVASIGSLRVDPQSTQNWINHFNSLQY